MNPTTSRIAQRSLAVAGAVLVTFIGLCHEFVGAQLFPHGPAAFGGPLGWHAAGLGGIAVGLLLIAGTLGAIAVPVAALALLVAASGAVIAIAAAVMWQLFHFFAVALVCAGLLVALCHRRVDNSLHSATGE